MKRKPIIPPRVEPRTVYVLTEEVTYKSGKTIRIVNRTVDNAAEAYRHAARETIDEAARRRGCTYMTCQFGEWSTTGRGIDRIEEDTRCKYCHSEKRERLVTRLALWLQWHDSLAVKP